MKAEIMLGNDTFDEYIMKFGLNKKYMIWL
jgi:hypothetical protein